VLDALRLGAYQLLHMGSVPDYAAVSQSVDQVRAVGGKGAAALANAVLRAVADGGEDPSLFPDPEGEPALHLASWGSHPLWLVERWLQRWPYKDVAALVDHDNRVPPLTVVPLELSPDAAARALRAQGMEAGPVEGTGCVEVVGADPARVLQVVSGVVQDPGSWSVVDFVAQGLDPGSWVADLCAAPGGKALALAGRGFYVLASDRSLRRLRLVRDNIVRTGRAVGVAAALAETPPVREAPVVLVDAPCTGTGTLRRHPDARWRLRPEDVEALSRVQARILDGAARSVAPGGLLVYSTCTLEPEENRKQVGAFLEQNGDFRLEAPAGGGGGLDAQGFLEVLPWVTGFDGAFAARLRRTGPSRQE
jgi:16S rRNA (cytosine967-C5)-methyltransferase